MSLRTIRHSLRERNLDYYLRAIYRGKWSRKRYKVQIAGYRRVCDEFDLFCKRFYRN